MLIGRAFLSSACLRSSAALNFVFVCFFVDFDFFSAIFISKIIKDIQKAPHRRFEIKEVSGDGGSDPPWSFCQKSEWADYATIKA